MSCYSLNTFPYVQEEESGSIDTGYAEEGDREEGEAPEFNDGKMYRQHRVC